MYSDAFDKMLGQCDAVILNQQVAGTLEDKTLTHRLNESIAESPGTIVLLDSRHYGQRFEKVWRKLNDVEAARLCGKSADAGDVIPLEATRQFATALYERSGLPVFLTLGSRGMIVTDDAGLFEIPGIEPSGKVDPVGAGDTTVSALACMLAAGADPRQAGQIANLAASVTVRKLSQTGTASPTEIQQAAKALSKPKHN